MPLTPYTASSTPDAASRAVSGLGTRRVHRSMTAPPQAPAATVARTISSDGLCNVLQKSDENRVAETREACHRDNRDQRGEQAILHEILAFIAQRQPAERRQHLHHGVRLSKTRGR